MEVVSHLDFTPRRCEKFSNGDPTKMDVNENTTQTFVICANEKDLPLPAPASCFGLQQFR